LKHKLKNTPINLFLEEGQKISEVAWYNSDENYKYLLIGTDDGSLVLLDLIQATTIQRFEKFGTCVENIVWLKNEPGTFFTTSKKSGRIVFWNVSKKTYKEISKISNAGILSIIPLSDPNHVLVSLDNGSVIIYDIVYERCLFELEPGHSETIFDLKFNPIEYAIAATCSYDSTIKIWNIEKNKVITTLRLDFNSLNVVLMNKKEKKPAENERISVYCLGWSLRDKHLLLSGDSKGSIKLWDISKSKLIYSTQCSSKEDLNIVGIDWDHKDNIIVGCYDNNVYLFRYEINKIDFKKVFKLGSSVYQIKFNPFVDSQFAAACNDFHVKICTFESEKPVLILSGHLAKVFGVEWNPKRKGILASSSDDDRIGIWEIEKKSNFFLSGHSSKTRHLVWLNDFPSVIISSSWDGTIKFWNVDTRANLITIIEHYSDVYGIGLSPHHPFLLISSSRDTSIRFWNFQNISKQLAKYLVDWHEDRKTNDVFHMNLQDQLKLAKDYIDSAEIISKYFFVNYSFI
jgi:WD40 repeat protein